MLSEFDYRNKENIGYKSQTDNRKYGLWPVEEICEAKNRDEPVREAKSMTELVSESVRQINSATVQTNVIRTGFDDFDKRFSGFHAGEFVVVGGRPAMGKTQFLINISLHISTKIPVLFVSFRFI